MKAWRALFVAVCLASLVPLWCSRYLPFPDISEHIASITIWHHLGDPKWDLDRYYKLSLGPNPYFVFYFLAHLLAYLTGVMEAVRILLSLSAVALPVGALLLARRFGRDERLALLVCPLVFNSSFTLGFTSFSFALGILPFALVLFDHFCERPRWTTGLAAAALGVTLFFTHLLPWGMYLAAAGLIGLLHQRDRGFLRTYSLRLLVWSAALAGGLAVIVWGRTYNMGKVKPQGMRASWVPLSETFKTLPWAVWNSCATWVGSALQLAFFVAWVVLFVTGLRRFTRRAHDWRAEACMVAAVVAYFVLPRSLHQPAYWWGINVRFAVIAALFAVLSVRGSLDNWRRWLLIPVALVGIGFSADLAVHIRRAAEYCRGYDELKWLPPERSRVLFIIHFPWRDPSFTLNYAQIYTGFYQGDRGGYMPWNFDEDFPLHYKARYPSPNWQDMQFRWDQHADYFDYVMAFQADRTIFGDHAGEVQLVKSAGKWNLFKLPGPRLDESPGPVYPKHWVHDPNWKPPPKPSKPPT